jgi:phospholipid-binding lipoprotein MlaA
MNKSLSISPPCPIKQKLPWLLLWSILGLVGCATTKEPAGQAGELSQNKDDPYENINRKVYDFNDKLDDYVAKPVADAYKFITPDFVERGVSNFFSNLKNVNVVTNDLLQGKFEQSGRDTGRLLMNTTLGMAGLFDVAKTVGLEQNDEDFDQTLAVWGVPPGSYIVLPLLGPITTRGIPGAVFDTAANPANYVGAPIQAISLVNARANAEGSLKFIDEAALDPYVFTRESFLQWRTHLVNDGKDETTTDYSDLDLEDSPSLEKKSLSNSSTTNVTKTPLPPPNVVNKGSSIPPKKQ